MLEKRSQEVDVLTNLAYVDILTELPNRRSFTEQLLDDEEKKEIGTIFIAIGSGLAFGTGYIAYGVLFSLIMGVILLIMEFIPIWDKPLSKAEKKLRITIPEDLNYTEVFDDLFQKYTKKNDLIRVVII